MKVLNVMWAGGTPYISVHKTHKQLLSFVPASAEVETWLLAGNEEPCCSGLGTLRNWDIPQPLLKGRGIRRWTRKWRFASIKVEINDLKPDLIVLDGIGVARVILPMLHQDDLAKTIVIFHSRTRLRSEDVSCLRQANRNKLRLVAVSKSLADSLERELHLDIRVLKSAFDPEKFSKALVSRDKARELLGIAPSARVFGAVGRLVESKGFAILIRAFARMAEHENIQLVIVGSGREQEALEGLIAELGVQDRITLLGHRTDMPSLYSAFDWLVIPSLSEGLGLVLQEAILSGVPVLCSDLPVFREQLKDAGLYAESSDEEAWIELIQHALGMQPDLVWDEQKKAMSVDKAWKSFKEICEQLMVAPSTTK